MIGTIIMPATGKVWTGKIVEWTGFGECVVQVDERNRYRGTLKEAWDRKQARLNKGLTRAYKNGKRL